MIKPNLLILLLILVTSCSMFDRRDYSNKMANFMEDGPMFRANEDFMVIAGDTGRDYRSKGSVDARTPFSQKDEAYRLEDASLRQEVRHLENSLSDFEYDKYQKIQKELDTDSEKIYFLSLSSSQRDEYLAIRKITNHNTEVHANYRAPIVRRAGPSRSPAYIPTLGESSQVEFSSEKEVILGMSMDEVADTLGAPERRDIAGNPEQMNERWAYQNGDDTRYIYFESGRVEGWTSESNQF